MPVEPFPWPQAMRFGFGTLGLSPNQFWSMSLPELNAALDAHRPASSDAPDRSWFDATLRQHPDERPQGDVQ